MMSKNLDIKILRTKELGRRDSVARDRHCLDHDCSIAIVGTRSDVTEHCGFRSGLAPKLVIGLVKATAGSS
ncbi:MAG: hypothetical protein WBD89_20025, partial [Candidatus Sulfotelmatobacter sp.]